MATESLQMAFMLFSEKLAKYAERRRMTQRDVAREASEILVAQGFEPITPSTMNRWWNGRGFPDLYEAAAMERVLGLPAGFLADEGAAEPIEPESMSEAALQAVDLVVELGLTKGQVIRALNSVRPEERRPPADRPAIVEPVSAPRPGTLPAPPPARSRSKGA
jgi:transcriptional regulator with XRE-family HTH domain